MPYLESNLGKKHYFGASPETIALARGLRKKTIPAEEKLWKYLRKRQLKNLNLRRQHPIQYFEKQVNHVAHSKKEAFKTQKRDEKC